MCKCNDEAEGTCPFAFFSINIDRDFGCLPSAREIVSMRVDFGKTWACHSDSSKPCAGALNYLKEKGLPYKVIDKKLVTLDDDYTKFIKDFN